MRSALGTLLAVAGGFALGYFGRGVIGSTDTRLEFLDRGIPQHFRYAVMLLLRGRRSKID
jgi:hypothetical protein